MHNIFYYNLRSGVHFSEECESVPMRESVVWKGEKKECLVQSDFTGKEYSLEGAKAANSAIVQSQVDHPMCSRLNIC